MRRLFSTLIGILLFVVSCKQKEIRKNDTEVPNSMEQIQNSEQYFENDSLRVLLLSDLVSFSQN